MPQKATEDTVNRAKSLLELEMFEDARTEFEEALKVDPHIISKIYPDYFLCLTKTESPKEATERIESILSKNSIPAESGARIRFDIGKTLERMQQKKLALKLYKKIKKEAPHLVEGRISLIEAGITTSSKYQRLLEKGLISAEGIKKASHIAMIRKKSVESILTEEFKIPKEEVGESLSAFYGCPFMPFDPEIAAPVELISKLKKSFLVHNHWVPLRWSKDGIDVLIDDPRDLRKTDYVEAILKTRRIRYLVGIQEDIHRYIETFFEEEKESKQENRTLEDIDLILDISFEEEEEEEEEEGFDESSSQVVRLVDQVIVAAYRKNASDIHIEPSEILKRTDIRLRVDGVCQEYLQVPNAMAPGILSRLKIMANLDIAEKRLPQDGKIKFKRRGLPPIELRMATLPTAGGYEDAVLRILAKSGAMKLEDTGMNERNLALMKKIVSSPHGLVLVVGPTGSGKTTTLHSALGYINKPGIKIWTAEDPVEITQPGLRQVEIKSRIGLDFARVMRAFLRADPDVIMVGEMRDIETASMGIEASLTGHLVLSTLHTNSAPETVTRLLEMGLNPINFSDAFLGVLAQRLVRRLCDRCKTAYRPSYEEFEEIREFYGGNTEFPFKYSEKLTLFKKRGCEVCGNSGYRGRLGIHEMMYGSVEIKRMIKRSATSEKLLEQAIADGMTTLKQDGISKVFAGATDMDEIKRVCVE